MKDVMQAPVQTDRGLHYVMECVIIPISKAKGDDAMKITIEGTKDEIAALVLAVQERRDMDAVYDYVLTRFGNDLNQCQQSPCDTQ